MGYSKYKQLRTVTKKFGLDAQKLTLFANIKPVEPSPWLIETLQKTSFLPLQNEKTKSERIVSPILVELAEFYQDSITLFSGENLEVRPEEDLSGECDFFFILAARKPYLESPIISITEAKDEDMDWGIAQCAAQIYGAKLFNEMEGKNFPILYGCSTDGVEWQFIKFKDNIFYLESKIYTDLREILGVWHAILDSYLC
ncbi:MAG: hypothetical protein H7A23_04405 [Leptospiraceae bacterium]|nr:hypothetical protein [Leptospiraceae bacterium]MCP5493775.1 hypothetical protein [Leptospiraceae bacterium]